MGRARKSLNKITGISTPFVGVQWESARLDADVARGVVYFIIDRRVLFAPHAVEVEQHCIQSVIEIRQYLTGKLDAGGIGVGLENHLETIRRSCRDFLDYLGPTPPRLTHSQRMGRFRKLSTALDRLRHQILGQTRALIKEYDIDISI